MKNKYLFLAFLFLIAGIAPVDAQQYGFYAYSLEQGLSQSEIYGMAQDKQGFIWVATNGGGICRFDGKKFIVKNRRDGLLDDIVSQLLADKEGKLWMNVNTRGISVYDGKKFKNYTAADSLLSNGGYRLISDAQGNVWIGSDYKAGSRFGKIENDRFVNYADSEPLLRNNRVLNAVNDPQQEVLLYTQNGFIRLANGKFSAVQLPGQEAVLHPGLRLHCYDSKGRLWFTISAPNQPTTHLGYFHGNKFTFLDVPPMVSQARILQMVEDKKGNLWMSTFYAGAIRYDGKNFISINQHNGLVSPAVLSLLADRQGNIWLGNGGGGLLRYEGEKFTRFTQKDGLNNDIVWGIYKDGQDTWIGTGSGGIYRHDGQQLHQYNRGQEALLGRVNAFLRTHDEQLYLASSNGIFRLEGQSFKQMSIPGEMKQLPNRPFTAHSFYEDHLKRLWISTTYGIIMLDGKKQTVLNPVEETPIGVSCVVQDSKKIYWIATDRGLARYDGNTFSQPGQKDELLRRHLLQVAIDKNDHVWGGGLSGLFRYDGSKTQAITTDMGLGSEIVYSTIADLQGNIWAGTQTGVTKITVKPGEGVEEIRNYERPEGFTGTENNGRASFREPSGKLWFGTIGGAVCYNPAEDVPSKVPPLVYVTGLQLFFKEINWADSACSRFSKGTEGWSGLPQQLSLPYDQNHLSFEFTALSYENPMRVRYQWKLEGLDKDWMPETDKTEAVYANLPPGTYTFKVRARGSNGVWSEGEATYRFSVGAPFWQTLWFRSVAVALLAGIAFAGVRMRVRSIEYQKKQLENQVRERTAEVVRQRDEILRRKEELQQQQEEIMTQNEQINQQNGLILEKNYELQFQKLELEKSSKAIMSSINYAQRIQEAILPLERIIKAALPESFILFKPRDVVSGDFYWFAEVEGRYIVAAVDCTGHGVPGAFMSIIGYNLLNEIIHHKHITAPAKILHELHRGIVKILKQEETRNRDGMDISICSVDYNTKTLEYAGAMNPMVIVQNGEMKTIKADRLPIGGWNLDQQREFTSHHISFSESPLTFYIYSDGYQDQFHHKTGQKIISKHFRNLLAKNAHLPVKAQEAELLAYFNEWKGDHFQVDDVLVMGFTIR